MLIKDKRWVIVEDCEPDESNDDNEGSNSDESEDEDEGKDNDNENDEGNYEEEEEVEGEDDKSIELLENKKVDSDFDLWKHCHLELFQLFVNWLSGNPDNCDSDFKSSILDSFDLSRFSSEELTTIVRKSSLYSDKDLFEALAQKNILLQGKNETLENQKKLLEKEKKNLVDSNSKLKKEKKDFAKIQVNKFVDFYFTRNRNYEYTYNLHYDSVKCNLDTLEMTAKEFHNQQLTQQF